MDLTEHFEKVDNCIKQLGVDPEKCRGEKPGQWNLVRGSASVWIDVFFSERNNASYFQCMAPICQIPDSNIEAFYQEVLETNHTLYGVGFTKFKNWLYIKTIRETEGLEESEILASMRRIGTYADDYDDHFKNKYFGGGNTPPTGS